MQTSACPEMFHFFKSQKTALSGAVTFDIAELTVCAVLFFNLPVLYGLPTNNRTINITQNVSYSNGKEMGSFALHAPQYAEETVEGRYPHTPYISLSEAAGFMGDVALSESDMKAMQAQKDYGESSSSSSDWTDDEDSDEFDVHSEVEASQYDLAESMNWDLTNSTRRGHNGTHRTSAKRQGRTGIKHGLWVPPWKKSGGNYSTGAGESKNRSRRAVMSTRHNIWPSGIVPFIMNSEMSNSARTVIAQAMRTWESLTCLKFVNWQPHHKSYLVFRVEDCGCCSYVGRQSDSQPQTVSIAPGCEVEGIVLHELGHALGFWHEQSRPDRDDYVQIFTQNIQPSNLFNFDKMSSKEVNSLGEPYDFNSIMHYHSSAFAKPGTTETIRPRPCCPRPQIGQRSKPSPSDVRQMNKLYNCPSTRNSPSGNWI